MSEQVIASILAQFEAVPDADNPSVPLHFGDPVGEQFAYEAGSGLAVLGPIGVVTVKGADRLTWLTTLSSQVLTGLSAGDCAELLLLDAQGRIRFAVLVTDDASRETTWLTVEPQYAAALAEFLESMRFMYQVSVADISADYVGFATANASSLTFEGAICWTDPWPRVAEGGAQYFQGNHPGAELQVRIFTVPVAEASDAIQSFIEAAELEAAEIEASELVGQPRRLVGNLAFEASRIAAWRPRYSAEVDDRAMPAELDWLRTAVHVDKGCFPGQESVARIINLGKPPRRLTFLQLDGSLGSIPQAGDAVMLGGRQVGVVTSVARHAEMGPIALALLKRNLDPEATLNIGDVAAAQELIVPVEGRADRSPAERPGAGLRRLDSGGRDLRTHGL